MDIYPNLYWGSANERMVRRPVRMIYLENRYLKVACNADIGGRVWAIYDKLGKRHAINYSSGIYSYNAGFGKNYTAGGMEINYPRAHSPTTRLPREYRLFRHEDGSASIMIAEYERKWRTRWSITYTLRPDRAFLEMTIRLCNRTPLDTRYMFWANCGMPVNDDTEFVFPEKAGALHGKETVTFSWPRWENKNMAMWKNVPRALGLYMLDASEPYFGYYDHRADCGLAHYADLADLPGKKYWSWGGACHMGREGARYTHHIDREIYGEVQAGRVVIQEYTDRVPPETEQQWTEYWYPVRGTGRFNGAGRDAVMRAEVQPAGRNASKLQLAIQGTGRFSAVALSVACGDREPVRRNGRLSISPESAAHCEMRLPYRPGKNETVVVTATGRDGDILGRAWVDPPRMRDSWTEVAIDEKRGRPVGAEEQFQEGENKARNWFYENPRAEYEKTLAKDPGFSLAHLEIGKNDIERGQYESAADHFTQALGRNDTSLEARYFLGVALTYAGQGHTAGKAFELSCQYDHEARSRIRLAELRMRDGEFHHAVRHLERVRDMAGRLTRPRGLLAACLRRLGRKTQAATEIVAARAIDPMDPFLQIEQMRIGKAGVDRKSLRDQVRNYEPPILEAAFDYGAAGLFDDALFALKVLSKPGPLASFYRAWLENRLGRTAQAKKSLSAACRLDPEGHWAWRLEMIPVLRWAIETAPKNPRPYTHLGNLLVARHRPDDARALWRQAERLGERSYLLYNSMGNTALNVDKDAKSALACFQKAAKLAPSNLYMKIAVAEALHALGRHPETIRYLTAQPKALNDSCVLSYHLLRAYLASKQYERFDAFCALCDFTGARLIVTPFRLWGPRHIQEGVALLDSGRPREALAVLEKAEPSPPNLGEGHKTEWGVNERLLYHLGRCWEQLGDMAKAKEFWEKATTVKQFLGWDPAYSFAAWSGYYYQALALKKLGRANQAMAIFQGIETAAKSTTELQEPARRQLMDMVIRGRFASESHQDPSAAMQVQVATAFEL